MTDERFLSAKEVAERRGCSVASVWRHTAAGKLPAPVRFSGGMTRWRLSELVEQEEAAAQRREGTAA